MDSELKEEMQDRVMESNGVCEIQKEKTRECMDNWLEEMLNYFNEAYGKKININNLL